MKLNIEIEGVNFKLNITKTDISITNYIINIREKGNEYDTFEKVFDKLKYKLKSMLTKNRRDTMKAILDNKNVYSLDCTIKYSYDSEKSCFYSSFNKNKINIPINKIPQKALVSHINK